MLASVPKRRLDGNPLLTGVLGARQHRVPPPEADAVERALAGYQPEASGVDVAALQRAVAALRASHEALIEAVRKHASLSFTVKENDQGGGYTTHPPLIKASTALSGKDQIVSAILDGTRASALERARTFKFSESAHYSGSHCKNYPWKLAGYKARVSLFFARALLCQ